MYIVKLYNGSIETEIHGAKAKVKSGSLVQGSDNVIDSLTFAMNPANPGFSKVQDYKTLVTVFNTRRNKFVFHGRVLCSTPDMDDSGYITKEVVCESFFGFLCDSKQRYVAEKNWTVRELWEQIISVHNSQVEEHKQFAIGEITAKDTNDNLYLGIQRDETWKTIKSKLIDKIGGEIRFRVVDGVTYIDHLEKIGETRATKIAISHNMKTIRQENDPTSYVSRLIPLGAKIVDAEGNETEERVDITSVNNGLDYIEDVDAKAKYGIRVDYVYYDDINTPSILKTRGETELRERNRVKVKYSITALELSLIGLDIDDLNVYDYYPVENPLLGIDDVARIIKKTTDICDETKSSIEVGDKFKTLSEIQAEEAGRVDILGNSVSKIEGSYVTTTDLSSESYNISSSISKTQEGILATVESLYSKKTSLADVEKAIRSELALLDGALTYKVTEAEKKVENVNGQLQSELMKISKYFTLDINGLTVGQVNNPNRIVIDNDKLTIYASGVPVQVFKSDGTSLIPMLTVSKMLNVLGLQITEDDTNINCDYWEVISDGG